MTRFGDAAAERLAEILAARTALEIQPGRRRRACVVAPLIRGTDGWSILFLRRSHDLRAHGGQVAFPGGAAMSGETLAEAALRETEEEVGIPADQVEIIGRMDDLITISGFVVAPFVGLIPSRFSYVLQAAEVVEVYEVPIDELMRPGNPEVRYIEYRGREYPSYFYQYAGVEIWGLTGRMVKALLDLAWLAI